MTTKHVMCGGWRGEAKENGEKSRRLEYDEKCFACAFYGRRVVVVVLASTPTSVCLGENWNILARFSTSSSAAAA